MRFPIPLVVDLDDGQLAKLFDVLDLPRTHGNGVRAKDAVEAVRAQVLAAVRRDFLILGVRADVSVRQ